MNSKAKKAFKVIGIILIVLVSIVIVCSLVSVIGNEANANRIDNLKKVVLDDPLPAPTIDKETGYYTFVTDREFKILQLTDVHIGGGFLAMKKDGMAINAIYDLISYSKPDLVVVTGDMAYPVPFSSGSFNNLAPARLFAELMDAMGVYWTVTYGNHDTEVYSFFDRQQISDFYEKEEFEYCLYSAGPEKIDGKGNHFINVENSDGLITQSLAMIDSHAYVKGVYQQYDNIHQNQIDWYSKEIQRMDKINRANGGTEIFKSLAFFHIPLVEYRTAYFEWLDNGQKDTDNVKFIYGIAGEKKKVVYSGVNEDEMFETMLELGSTQGVFTGHDHYNNFSLYYNGGSGDKYIRLTYGMSIDYLAYFGIWKKTAQRGGTIITVQPDSTFDCYGLRLAGHEIIE